MYLVAILLGKSAWIQKSGIMEDMVAIRNNRMKNLIKKFKVNFLFKTSSSEIFLLIIVIALIFFKYKSDIKPLQKLPTGDYESTPTSKHAQAMEEIQDLLRRN